MDFRIKCAAQHILSIAPLGDLNRLLGRALMGSSPVSAGEVQRCTEVAAHHLAAFEKLRGARPRTVFEFGSGQSLSIPIIVGRAGCKVIASDIGRYATRESIDARLNAFGAHSLD